MKTREYKNHSGGRISCPIPAKDSHLVGAVANWKHIDDGDVFAIDVDGDTPVNPSFAVMAKGGLIKPVSQKKNKP